MVDRALETLNLSSDLILAQSNGTSGLVVAMVTVKHNNAILVSYPFYFSPNTPPSKMTPFGLTVRSLLVEYVPSTYMVLSSVPNIKNTTGQITKEERPKSAVNQFDLLLQVRQLV